MNANMYVADVKVFLDETDDERPVTVILKDEAECEMRCYLSVEAADKLLRELRVHAPAIARLEAK